MIQGWSIQCWADGNFIRYSFNSDENLAETIWYPLTEQANDEFAPTPCCGGSVPEETADDACAEQCQRLLCKEAQSHHLDLADSMNGIHICQNKQTCGFDMNACLSGNWHKQTIQFLVTSDDYWLRAQCDGARTNTVYQDGIPAWNNDDPTTGGELNSEPPMCAGAASVANDPGVVFSDDQAVEDAGTIASVTWTMGGTPAIESSQDAAVSLGYDVHACDGGRCLDLSELRVTLPATTAQGLLIEHAQLAVYQVDTAPVLQSTGSYAYPPGTIHAIMSATVGGVRFTLKRTNIGTAQVQLAPAADTLTFSGLAFDYTDSLISAQLQLDIVGNYTERGPTTVIVPVNVPVSCTDPVTFRAASTDPDGQGLSHLWWVPNTLVSTGPTLDVVLSNGPHVIAAISKDPDGHLDAGAITYTRTCN